MTHLTYKLIFGIFLLPFYSVFAQYTIILKQIERVYVYKADGKINISQKELVSEQISPPKMPSGVTYTGFNPKMPLFRKRKYKKYVKNDEWIRRLGIYKKEERGFRYKREIIDKNGNDTTIRMDSLALSNEIAFYTAGQHLSEFVLFHIKERKEDSSYSTLKYKVFGYYIFSLKEVHCLENNPNYKIFVYSVIKPSTRKVNKPYLELSFCPQFGIVEYYYIKPNIHIRLDSVSGKPISYYLQNNMCLTPFCDIK